MALSIPVRLANGVGNPPLAENWMDDYDWLTAIASGLVFIANGGMELWAAGTTFTNPTNGTVLADNWTEIKSGTTPCTADVTREASVINTGTYSMKVNITGAGSSDSYWAIKQSNVGFVGFSALTVVAGVAVKCATANKVRIKVYDGTTSAFSSFHTGDGTWQVLQAKLTCAAIPTEMTVTIEINPANFTDAIYMDSAFLYNVPSAISARAQTALVYSPLGTIGSYLPLAGGTMTGNIAFSPTTKGITGTTTNDNAAAGTVGEVIAASKLRSAATSISTASPVNAASISLTAGDWDIRWGFGVKAGGATTYTLLEGGISITSGSFSASGGDSYAVPNANGEISVIQQGSYAPGSGNDLVISGIPTRVSLSGTTPIYLVVRADFSGSTSTYYGSLTARRIR